MTVTKLFYDAADVTTTPPFARRIAVDTAAKRFYISTGTTAASDWVELQKVSTPIADTPVVLTEGRAFLSADTGKTFIFSGQNLLCTLPTVSTLTAGWKVTIVNNTSGADLTAAEVKHTSSPVNCPVGKLSLLVRPNAADTATVTFGVLLDIQTTDYFFILPPGMATSIVYLGGGKFANLGDNTVGWKSQTLNFTTFTGTTNTATNAAINIGASPSGAAFNKLTVLRFTKQTTADSEREINLSTILPADFLMGSTPLLVVYWTTGDIAFTGNTVGWGLDYTLAKIGNLSLTTPANMIMSSSGTGSVPAFFVHTPYFTFPTAGLTPQTAMHLRLYRNSATGNLSGDNFASSALLLRVNLVYLSTSGGTQSQFPPYYL